MRGAGGAATAMGEAANASAAVTGRAMGTVSVILDPPATWLAPRIAAQLAAARPSEILYVSCNPATLARDLGDALAAKIPHAQTGIRALASERIVTSARTPKRFRLPKLAVWLLREVPQTS